VAMPAVKVRSDYDQLKQISSKFGAANSAVAGVNKKLTSAMDQLKKGDWIGQGAKKFYAEMDSDVMPSMKRLEKAMAEAAKITNQIAKLVKQAEDDSSRLFRL
jgi:WXG100 family type VII secretion target